MRHLLRQLAAASFAFSLAACAVGTTVDEDRAEAGGAADDAATDVAPTPDAPAEATPDVGVDADVDAEVEAASDAQGDVAAEVATDVTFDVSFDVSFDAPRDVGVDVPTDVSLDVGRDVGVDVGRDVGVDVGVDANPCAGVACTTPPPSACDDATNLRIYDATGTCSLGQCTYGSTVKACTHGCANGACQACAVDVDCGAGRYCSSGRCFTCSTDAHCGATCSDCTLAGGVCANGTACAECVIDATCGASSYCNAGACAACNSASKCGPSCVSCGGATPDCSGTACVCNATSCGAGAACTAGACVACDKATSCGPSCVACSGTTPACGGTTVGCQCTSSPDSCGGTSSWCNAGTCAACGAGSCGNGRCDCGETTGTCAADCGPPCPSNVTIGDFASGNDGWTLDGLWRRDSAGYMVAGSSNSYNSSYEQSLTYGADVNLASCGSATFGYIVKLADDPTWSPCADKSERLYVECSGNSGASWTTLTPTPWPPNQSACATSYCAGGCNSSRAFGWSSGTISLPAACLTANARFRFRAKGSSAWRMQNPGWYVDTVRVN